VVAAGRYAQQFAADAAKLLQRVPRALLLLLKTNDCLRSVDASLGQARVLACRVSALRLLNGRLRGADKGTLVVVSACHRCLPAVALLARLPLAAVEFARCRR
jgi:hypothetical protein